LERSKYFFWPRDDAQNFVDAKTDVKDEIAEEQEVKMNAVGEFNFILLCVNLR
jgi:hypothetical protein